MRFYDCDDEGQFSELSARMGAEDLSGRNLVQTFSPDTPLEARNRSYRPV
jgi:hypothetical protein